MPGSHIRNPGFSIQEEVGSGGVQTFQLWKKQSQRNVGTLFFFTAFLPYVWNSVFFQSGNVRTPPDPTSSCMLEPGFRILLPGILWHYNLHQMKLFKDFAPKKSNLIHTAHCTLQDLISPIFEKIGEKGNRGRMVTPAIVQWWHWLVLGRILSRLVIEVMINAMTLWP